MKRNIFTSINHSNIHGYEARRADGMYIAYVCAYQLDGFWLVFLTDKSMASDGHVIACSVEAQRLANANGYNTYNDARRIAKSLWN